MEEVKYTIKGYESVLGGVSLSECAKFVRELYWKECQMSETIPDFEEFLMTLQAIPYIPRKRNIKTSAHIAERRELMEQYYAENKNKPNRSKVLWTLEGYEDEIGWAYQKDCMHFIFILYPHYAAEYGNYRYENYIQLANKGIKWIRKPGQ
jgi:hypothetical protein